MFLLLAICFIYAVVGQNVTVDTILGDVIGQQMDGYVLFRGIPYAENPPIANLRFTESVLRTSVLPKDPYPALDFSPSCIQPITPLNEAALKTVSEDCLYLNIYAPNIDENGTVSTDLLPVMVFIHGGGFIVGSSSQYNGAAFMRRSNVVLVTINYRLDALGFMSLQSVYDETNGKMTGGMNGVNDQIVALQWVQSYISDYGGDPNQVTIFGQSAGGISSCYLSLIPKASGLFDQIIIQSGHCSSPYGGPRSTQYGMEVTADTLSNVGLTDDLNVLRAVDASTFNNLNIWPSVDGYIFKQSAHDMLSTGNYTLNADKIIVGSVSLDSVALWPLQVDEFGYGAPETETEFDAYLGAYITNETQQTLLKELYYPMEDFTNATYSVWWQPDQFYDSYRLRWGAINADVCFKCPGYWYGDILNTNNNDGTLDLYMYDFIGPYSENYKNYIVHGGDIGYEFWDGTALDNVTIEYLGVANDPRFSYLFQDIWTNFGEYGVPNSSTLTEQWRMYGDTEGKNGFLLGNDNKGNANYNVQDFYSNGYRNGVCHFWVDEIGWNSITDVCLGNKEPLDIVGSNVTISTQLGDVMGVQQDGFVSFRGISFVKNQPVGDYRLTEAELNTESYSMDPYPALSFGPSCMQSYDPTIGALPEVSEDCLYVNVYTPNSDGGELLPVMVWIYGGGFVSGSSVSYTPDGFMRNEDVVLVTFNYRIGALGFASLRSIYNETNGKSSGGMNGVNDQIVALQWVQNYISDYGGDPNQVTIFGESAGGFSSCYLSLIPKAAGLFDKIIIQSGHCSPPYANPQAFDAGITNSITQLGSVGLTDNLTELRAADATLFLDLFIGPAVDRYLLQSRTLDLLSSNNYTINADKIIIGTVNLDTLMLYPFFFTLFGQGIPNNSVEFEGYLQQYILDENQQDLIRNTYYPLSDFPAVTYNGTAEIVETPITLSSEAMRWGTMSTDCCWTCGALWYATKLIENNNTNKLYVYNFVGPENVTYNPHGVDVAYEFYSSDQDDMLFDYYGVSKDGEFSILLQDTWINFAKHGSPNPNSSSAIMFNEEWVPFDASTGSAFILGSDGDGNGYYNVENFVLEGYRNGVCDFWINDIGWNMMEWLCLGVFTLAPTDAPTMEPEIVGSNVTISTQLGDVVGIQQDGFVSFRGIPFAKVAPVGDYRFTEAELKTESYSMDPLPALAFGPSCMQSYDPTNGDLGELSEDCLYINVYTPNSDVANGELLPVMVWIYGGGFVSGSSVLYNPDGFMRNENVVLVTFNYRVGALGFASLRSIYNETNGKMTGGMNGLNDQIVALQWVQNYISDYGGDPNQVTIFGESAGGWSSCFLSLIPKAAGLFDKIIIQSGHCEPAFKDSTTFEAGIANTVTQFSYRGLTDNLAALRAEDVTSFLGLLIGPVVDGYLIKSRFFDMLSSNNYTINADKIIIGTVDLDTLNLYPFFSTLFGQGVPNNSREFEGYLKQYIPDTTQQDLIKNTYYPLSDFPAVTYNGTSPVVGTPLRLSNEAMRWGTMSADCCFTCGALWYVQKLIENNNTKQLYVYHFVGPENLTYSPHGVDVGYEFFVGAEDKPVFDYYDVPFDAEFSTLLQDIWVNFARNGVPNPNSSSSITLNEKWVPFDASTQKAFILGSDRDGNGYYMIENFISEGYRNGVCNFWINEIGWDIMDYLCYGVFTLEPTMIPTTTPSMEPTIISEITPTMEPIIEAMKGDGDKSNESNTWMIVAIIFIVLFIIVLSILLYYCYIQKKNNGETRPSGYIHEKVESGDVAEMTGTKGGDAATKETDDLL